MLGINKKILPSMIYYQENIKQGNKNYNLVRLYSIG